MLLNLILIKIIVLPEIIHKCQLTWLLKMDNVFIMTCHMRYRCRLLLTFPLSALNVSIQSVLKHLCFNHFPNFVEHIKRKIEIHTVPCLFIFSLEPKYTNPQDIVSLKKLGFEIKKKSQERNSLVIVKFYKVT